MCDQSVACVAYPSSRLQACMQLSPTLSLPLSAIDLDKETPFPKQHDAIRFAFQRSLRHDAARFFRPSPCESHQGISFRSFSRLFPSLSCQQPRLAEPILYVAERKQKLNSRTASDASGSKAGWAYRHYERLTGQLEESELLSS